MSALTPHEARQLLGRAGAVGLEDDGARRVYSNVAVGSGVPLLTLTWFVFLSEPPAASPLVAALAGLVNAAPAVVAGLLIRRGGRR